MVTTDSRKRTQISVLLLVVLDVSATEKKMMAIMPINNALKNSKTPGHCKGLYLKKKTIKVNSQHY